MPFGSFFSNRFSNRGRSKEEVLETTKVQVDREPTSDAMNIPPMDKENNSHTTVPKKMMEASDLLSKPAMGRENAIDAVLLTRRGSGEMKYSSISARTVRIPSARAITNQCFPSAEEEPSSTPSPEDSYDDEFETYTVDSKEASPKSRAIMEEMNRVYQLAPIPESYLTSAPKKTPVLPEIILIPTQMMASKEKSDESAVGVVTRSCNYNGTSAAKTVDTKTAYGKHRRSSSIPRQVSSADKGYGVCKSNGATSRRNHRNSSAPSVSQGIISESRPSSSPPPSILTTTTASRKQPTPLTVLREEEQRNQRAKDAMSSSNEKDGRRNLDKRTARLRFADAFKQDIMQYRQRQPFLNNVTNHSGEIGGQIQDRGLNGVSIAVRKRPMFDYELDRGDFDVVSIDNTNEKSHDLTIVHNCVMHADMRRMFIKPTSYPVTAAFDEHCSDDDVYRHVAEPLVNAACCNNVSTILMYGQTGCGKSHTMAGIEKRMASTIFLESKGDIIVISLTFVELCGNRINDLLIKGTSGIKALDIKVLDLDDGTVRLLNASVIEVKSPKELLERILLAKGRRATEATDMNGVSSRSHAVCQIEIKDKRLSSNNRGLLTLIDCAGSERSHDSLYHSSERQKESAEINASLYALKECIRAKSKNARIPFRSSNLTRILKESFERNGARLCVIACVAPNATDTEHTMETLKTASTVVGVEDQIKEELAHEVVLQQRMTKEVAVPPSAWDHQQLKTFLTKNKMERVVLLTQKHDGKLLMKMSVLQMRAQLFDEKDKEFAQTLFDLLRKENDRVSVIQRKERANNKLNRKGSV